ncbi:MAG: D-alanine--D-alanine ligase [Holosporaceae bacterium]|nr:D-alanine--D-alanine ligase [Holosporaceae bacterium]
MNKIRVGVFFGGRSSEHEVSIISAESVIKNLDPNKYEIIPIGIDKNGKLWFKKEAIASNLPTANQITHGLLEVCAYLPSPPLFSPQKMSEKVIDVAFPVLHGSFGEDGSIQGLFKILDIPFIGAGVLGSAIAMDKDITKRLLKEANIPIARYMVFNHYELDSIKYGDVTAALGNIIFVKPASLGSSVGISKVKTESEFKKALKEAFSYDNKVLLEEFIQGREVECSVLGNDYPAASVLGEIVVKKEFYSYEAKYLDKEGATLVIPADFSKDISDATREIAIKAFRVLSCEGMARVDFFITKDSRILLNEVNTIPGFTKISMYPKLWEASGVSYRELLDKLITLAISRYDRDKKLRTNFIAPSV